MPKITFIGAGSIVFTRNLTNDILQTPALSDSTIVLMDIDAQRLEQSRQIVQSTIDRRGVKATVAATLDRKEAIEDSDYVITTFQQGGLDAYQLDIEIPQQYGIEQCVGDTLGPGGVFRALRTIPVLIDICSEIDQYAPEALLLNYVNPMAANCWAIAAGTGLPHVGLCHSVQGTSQLLAEWIKVPYAEVIFFCAGINHQAFFLEFRTKAEDLYPKIIAAVEDPAIYGQEPVRIDLLKYFGYFVTESSGHASEYVPYFRKTAKMVNHELVPRFTDQMNDWFEFGRTGGYLRHCHDRVQKFQQEYQSILQEELSSERTHEYGARIIEAIETNRPITINGNVPNDDLIDNLPGGCCVEVPCLVDGNGIQPIKVGPLPAQLAALNRTNINVQELIVEA
ncbi:MAG TPA: alpha-galactosidase, partial [Chthoniobacterales bacterium]|nr:alpha-galactosidase [Chthoniobacterales bacterium]